MKETKNRRREVKKRRREEKRIRLARLIRNVGIGKQQNPNKP